MFEVRDLPTDKLDVLELRLLLDKNGWTYEIVESGRHKLVPYTDGGKRIWYLRKGASQFVRNYFIALLTADVEIGSKLFFSSSDLVSQYETRFPKSHLVVPSFNFCVSS